MLLQAVARALPRDAEARIARERRSQVRTRCERLTSREREVFAHLISGQLNKQTACDLCGDYLHKPCEAETILELLRALLEHHPDS